MLNRHQIEYELGKNYGRTIGFIANVINCHHSRPMAKLLGLSHLAARGLVTTGGSIDQVNIAGRIRPIGDLEKCSLEALGTVEDYRRGWWYRSCGALRESCSNDAERAGWDASNEAHPAMVKIGVRDTL